MNLGTAAGPHSSVTFHSGAERDDGFANLLARTRCPTSFRPIPYKHTMLLVARRRLLEDIMP